MRAFFFYVCFYCIARSVLALMAAGSECNSECRQIASGLSRSNSAHPLLTRNSSQKAGKTLSEVIKGRAPLSELNANTVHPEKRKVGRPKKAKFTDENLRLTGKNHHPIKKPRTTYLQHIIKVYQILMVII